MNSLLCHARKWSVRLAACTVAAIVAVGALTVTQSGRFSETSTQIDAHPVSAVSARSDHAPTPVHHVAGETFTLTAAQMESRHITTNVSTGHGPGYSFEDSHLQGTLVTGLKVYVRRADTKANRNLLYSDVRRAVAAQRKLGIRITLGGWCSCKGTPPRGQVWVVESKLGCNDGMAAWTSPWFTYLDSVNSEVSYATIYICRARALGAYRDELTDTVLHEMGHAVGLGHTNYNFKGHEQVMNWIGSPSSPITYQAGDKAGLRRIAALTNRRRADAPPTGSQSFTVAPDGSLVITGKATNPFGPGRAITVQAFDWTTGHTLASTKVVSGHAYRLVVAASHANGSVQVKLISWNGAATTLPFIGTDSYKLSSPSQQLIGGYTRAQIDNDLKAWQALLQQLIDNDPGLAPMVVLSGPHLTTQISTGGEHYVAPPSVLAYVKSLG